MGRVPRLVIPLGSTLRQRDELHAFGGPVASD